jgi:Na+-driven multidrug efflux pump
VLGVINNYRVALQQGGHTGNVVLLAIGVALVVAAIVCNGVFVGAGDTLKPAFMSLASMWGVRLTLAWYLSKDYGLMGVWMAMAIELTFRGIIFLTRLFTGNWNNKLKLKMDN